MKILARRQSMPGKQKGAPTCVSAPGVMSGRVRLKESLPGGLNMPQARASSRLGALVLAAVALAIGFAAALDAGFAALGAGLAGFTDPLAAGLAAFTAPWAALALAFAAAVLATGL